MVSNSFCQFPGSLGRLHFELVLQRSDTSLVLSQSQVILPLLAVTVHQQAMRILAAIIAFQGELAERNAGCQFPLAEINMAEMIEEVEIRNA